MNAAASPLTGRASDDGTYRHSPDAVDLHFLRRGHGAEFEMEAEWIRRRLPPGAGPLLDIGCGNGALFPFLKPAQVIGVDYQWAGLTHTKRQHGDTLLLCGDASQISLADANFEAITAQHVIEHMPDASNALIEWRRLLRPGGRILLLTPNTTFCDPDVFADPTHVRLFDRDELRQAVIVAGLEVLEMRTIGLPFFRNCQRLRGAWRFRQLLLQWAEAFSVIPGLRWAGQTLCCVARRPMDP